MGRTVRSMPDILVIADATRPQAIGGVMGGGESEVSRRHPPDRARERLVRADGHPAHQQAPRACRPRRRTGSSAAPTSRRLRSRWRARARCWKRRVRDTSCLVSWTRIPAKRERRLVEIDTTRVAQVLGADVPTSEITRTLEGLGFGVVPQAAPRTRRHQWAWPPSVGPASVSPSLPGESTSGGTST